MKSSTTHFASPRQLALGLTLLLLAATVTAQSSTDATTPAGDARSTTAAATQVATDQLEAPYWEPIGGFEADSHGTGYGFFGPSYVRPVRDNLAFTARIFGDYLYYSFGAGDGGTTVHSPGVSTGAGLRFGTRNWFQFQAGPALKRRHVEFRDPSGQPVRQNDTRVGLNVGADAYVNPTSHNNIHGMLQYGTVDRYTWGRVGFKEQLNNHTWRGKFTHYLGVEFIGQGNQDIRSQQVGGFVEFLHVPSSMSIMLRAGYKRSSFDVGPDKTGPWFAVGFYQRLK